MRKPEKGSLLNPYKFWVDLAKGLQGRMNCTLYVRVGLKIPQELFDDAKSRNIIIKESDTNA